MPTLRSVRWMLVMTPVLSFAIGCGGNNEAGVEIKGTNTSPDALLSPEEKAKRAAEAPKKNVIPKGYPR